MPLMLVCRVPRRMSLLSWGASPVDTLPSPSRGACVPAERRLLLLPPQQQSSRQSSRTARQQSLQDHTKECET